MVGGCVGGRWTGGGDCARADVLLVRVVGWWRRWTHPTTSRLQTLVLILTLRRHHHASGSFESMFCWEQFFGGFGGKWGAGGGAMVNFEYKYW